MQDAAINNLVILAGKFGTNILTEDVWKALGDNPKYLDRFLNNTKHAGVIAKFYQFNPQHYQNIELAKHLLFQTTSNDDLNIIHSLFKNDTALFFTDITKLVQWITQSPAIIKHELFDIVRSSIDFFHIVKDIPGIYLGYLKVNIPDEPEQIKPWLQSDSYNYLHLPEKYRDDLEMFNIAVEPIFDKELITFFNHASQQLQQSFEIAKIFIDKDLYSYLPEYIRAKTDVFMYMMDTKIQGMQESVSSHIANSEKKSETTSLYFLKHIPSIVLQDSSNVVKIFEFMNCAKYGKDWDKIYKNWFNFLKLLKKEDSFIASKFDEVDDKQPKWHLGLIKDHQYATTIENRIYFYQTLRELSEIYKIYYMAQTMRKELPMTSAPIRKTKI